MKRMPGSRHLLPVVLAATTTAAGAFEHAFELPAFVVSVPGIPSIPLAPRAATASPGARVALGHDATFTVEITASESSQAGSTRACAGTFLRELVKRPDMPDRDSIYRAPFDASTFLVLYIVERQGVKALHAHLLSAAAGTHCVDAHFSRVMGATEDVDRWRTTFTGARIREGRR